MESWGCTWSGHMGISNPNLSLSLIVEGEVGEEKNPGGPQAGRNCHRSHREGSGKAHYKGRAVPLSEVLACHTCSAGWHARTALQGGRHQVRGGWHLTEKVTGHCTLPKRSQGSWGHREEASPCTRFWVPSCRGTG